MSALSTAALAHAIAQIVGPFPMSRRDVVKVLKNGAGMTVEQADEVIAYGLAQSLLIEDPADPTQFQGAPKPSGQL
jgi:hypothetical protein